MSAKRMRLQHKLHLAVLLTLVISFVTRAESEPPDLSHLSLEQLMQIEVTTVSKQPEKLSQSPAAISVITQDDIHRMGATSLPEALRYVPGLQVARLNAHSWAVTARGFNNVSANKLLVMIDGRTIYTPLFSGVYWDMQDILLDDIDRIEVIRGPGAAIWGANAVNGVINIITRSAKETQGGLLETGGGTEDQGSAALRYGGKITDNSWYRIYGKFNSRDDSRQTNGVSAFDSWQSTQGGMRIDWEPSAQNKLTFQSDGGSSWGHQLYYLPAPTPPFRSTTVDSYNVYNANARLRWDHEFSDSSSLYLQAFFDYLKRDFVIFGEERRTGDIELQHRLELGTRHVLSYGLEYRVSADDIRNAYTFSIYPEEQSAQLFSTFIRDEITLYPDKLKLTLGTEVEYNDFSGVELQPSARLLWTPMKRYSFWTAVSRAVHTPSRIDRGISLSQPGPLPGTLTRLNGNPDVVSEKLMAYEVGVHARPLDRMSFSVAAFYNDYDDLRGVTPQPIQFGVPTVIPQMLDNNIKGESYGFELGPTFQATDWWRLQASYTFFKLNIHRKNSTTSSFTEALEGNTPQQQFTLRSSFDLPHNIEFDAGIRYTDSLPTLGVPDYLVMDLRLAWRPTKQLELSIVGQSLLDRSHLEYTSAFIASAVAEVEQGIYGQVTWRF